MFIKNKKILEKSIIIKAFLIINIRSVNKAWIGLDDQLEINFLGNLLKQH